MTPKALDRRALPAAAKLSRWAAPDGWDYRRLDWLHPKGAAVRGNLLFAGGRGDFIEKYLEPADHWFHQGWNVTTFDWRGQGGSRGNIVGGHLETFDPLVDDLAAFLAAWAPRAEGPRVAIGHSMGGHLLLRTLAERKPAVDAAVLIAPMLAINSGPLPEWAASSAATAMTMFGMGGAPAWHDLGSGPGVGSLRQTILTACTERYEDELWWWEREPGFNLGTPSWGWIKAAYASSARLSADRLRAVKTPILLLGAERDRLVSAPAIRAAAAQLPNAELHMFADAAHELLRDTDDVRLEALARIDDFLDRRARR
jgi:lysophospholipase